MVLKSGAEAIQLYLGYLLNEGIELTPEEIRAFEMEETRQLFLDIEKAIQQLTEYDRQIILRYCFDIFCIWDEGAKLVAFNQWPHRAQWSGVCERLWEKIPDDYKEDKHS
ncbi:MAG: hypothetical protein JRI39_00740 [Deltaproteobacteria bacterium]|nr:hypothetical protein [Deltaproteobacteria bacterium]